MIEVTRLSKQFNGLTVLDDITASELINDIEALFE